MEEPSQGRAQDGEGSTTLDSQCDCECSSICAPFIILIGKGGIRDAGKSLVKEF